MLKIKHLASASLFNTTKFSADSSNTTYYIGNNTSTQIAGTPDVLYEDIVFCKSRDLIYTHGHFYCSSLEERVGDLEEKNYIESPSAIQSLEVTDDNIQVGHYADTSVNNAAFLLGNGTSSTPHNALVVDWNGNLSSSGNITDGQGNTLADLPTKATLGDVLVDGNVVLWDATNQKLVTATTDQLRNLLMWIGTEAELRTLQQNDSLEEGKLYATLDNTYFS